MLRSLRARRVAKLPGAVHLPGRVLFLAEDPQLVRDQLDGKDLDWRPDIKLRDDISTDEITPAYICYYYDDTLGDFPYLGLKCGEEFPVTRGSVKRGGFTASVSGKRRGKGSSREQSPYAEMCAGIKLVVAENIERIYRENCQNLGLLTTTDFSILDRVRSGRSEEHTSELQSLAYLVCRLLLEKKKKQHYSLTPSLSHADQCSSPDLACS